MYLLYVGCNSEADYQFRYLFQNVAINQYLFITPSQLTRSFMVEHLQKNNNESFILVLGANTLSQQTIEGAITIFEPKILVINGDEHRRFGHLLGSAEKTELLLYQYIGHYRTDPTYQRFKDKILHIPQGPYPGVFKGGIHPPKDALLSCDRRHRRFVWSFMGDIHSKRVEGLQAFMQSFEQKDYLVSQSGHTRKNLIDVCKQSVFVLNLHAHGTLESPRLCYTIRCGAIPVVVGPMEQIVNTFTFNKERAIPFVHSTTWDDAIRQCKELIRTNGTQVISDACYAWLDQVENSIIQRIDEVADAKNSYSFPIQIEENPNKMGTLTVMITCSHIPSHPSIELVQKAIESLDHINMPPDTKIILAHDYSNDQPYIEYLQNLHTYIGDKPNIKIVNRSDRGYLTGNIKNAMQHINSEYILKVEHDLHFIQDIDICNIIEDMRKLSELKYVRFNIRANIKAGSDAQNDLFGKQLIGQNCTYTRTPSWSDQNHLCKSDYYKEVVFKYGGDTFPETTLYYRSTTEANHSLFGTYIYGPVDHPAVIHNMDGQNYKRTTMRNYKYN